MPSVLLHTMLSARHFSNRDSFLPTVFEIGPRPPRHESCTRAAEKRPAVTIAGNHAIESPRTARRAEQAPPRPGATAPGCAPCSLRLRGRPAGAGRSSQWRCPWAREGLRLAIAGVRFKFWQGRQGPRAADRPRTAWRHLARRTAAGFKHTLPRLCRVSLGARWARDRVVAPAGQERRRARLGSPPRGVPLCTAVGPGWRRNDSLRHCHGYASAGVYHNVRPLAIGPQPTRRRARAGAEVRLPQLI